jgi:hypothetical protein
MEKRESAYRVVLPSGRKVVLREPKISHRNLAAAAVGNAAGDNMFTFGILMSQEMIRLLIAQIDDQPVSLKDRSELDSHFSAKEYSFLEKIYKMIGGEEESPLAPAVEIINIGNS